MRIIRDFNIDSEECGGKPLALTLGNFDGVHLGHLEIIKVLRSIAHENGLASAVLTFEPHPVSILKPQVGPFRLTSQEQKIELLEKTGIDELYLMKFDKRLANLSAENFITDILLKKLNAKHLVIGHDFNFGKNREGNSEFLKKAAAQYNFSFTQVDSFGLGKPFSSSLARQFLREGNVKEAREILGHDFAIRGEVGSGAKQGRVLGFPTANIELGDYLRPRFGVYKTLVDTGGGNWQKSIANIGIKPTLADGNAELLEVHIFNFINDIYGLEITVRLVEFLREEKKFNGIEELKKQIALDIEKAK